MKRCSVAPYEGNERYIFVSYCHKDKAKVFPVIERLVRDGYRVWYDEGIDPGSEWPEIIANHLNGCSVCIAFISESSLNSHNCRREINFALLKKKFFISVILESVQMSLGMEMQLSSSQSIFRFSLSENEFFEKLYHAGELKQCQGEPDPSVRVSSEEDYYEAVNAAEKRRDPFSDRWFSEKYPIPENAPISSEKELNGTLTEEQVRRHFEDSTTIASPAKRIGTRHILIRTKTNERIEIDKDEFVIGRSYSSADYVISDSQSISRVHAIFSVVNGICCVRDNGSLNKTFINGQELQAQVNYLLKDGDSVRLYNENFTYNKID